ncbi:MAG TPA: RDD family protein [Planctomycetaceae bacterium]|nr:RDD family protein [Planctomycetaceae bacterium]
MSYAGFWRRVIAHLIDQFVIGIAVGLFCLPLFLGLFGADTVSSELGRSLFGAVYVWMTILIRAPVALLYYASMEGAAVQGTLGKLTLGIVVTDEAGRRISFVRALGRNFCKSLSGAVFGLGYLAAAFTQRKQALHDLMSGCLVVEK